MARARSIAASLAPLALLAPVALAAACAEALKVGQSQLTECKDDALPAAVDPTSPPASCEECAESKCCGALGRCSAEASCLDRLHDHVRCVAAQVRDRRVADPEAQCSPSAPSGTAGEVYACVRDQCGASCSVATCKVDVATPRLGSASCDACLVARACDEINACYRDRGCRLFVDCVARDPACVAALVRQNPQVACDAGVTPSLPACASACAAAGVGDPCATLPLLSRLAGSACDCSASAPDAAAGGG